MILADCGTLVLSVPRVGRPLTWRGRSVTVGLQTYGYAYHSIIRETVRARAIAEPAVIIASWATIAQPSSGHLGKRRRLGVDGRADSQGSWVRLPRSIRPACNGPAQ